MTTRRKAPVRRSVTSRIRAVLPNLVRLAAFLLALYGLGLFVVARQVRAETNEILMGVGAEMMRFAAGTAQDEPRTLHLNGQQLAFGSGHTTDHSVEQVLDFFEARCRSRDGRLVERIDELMAARNVERADLSMFDGTLRESTARGGYVACFDVGEEREGVRGLLTRLESFVDSGNLAALGGLRYVYAKPTSDGGTHFLVFHTDDRLNVYEMFPATGDAPGADVPGVPRPAHVRRLMSAWEDADPHSLTLYTSVSRNAEQLEAWYAGELPRAGWRIFAPSEGQLERFTEHWSPRDREIARDARAIHAEQGERQVMIVFTDDARSAQSVATVLTMR